MHKTPLGQFLALNPFPNGLTDGLFYREKMRAIHRVAPGRLRDDAATPRVLDIGGGRSGLASLLYPTAYVVCLDADFALHGQGPPTARSLFVCGRAEALPFADGAFDAVMLLDVLEHIEADAKAAGEALRVTRPGGAIVASTPSARWRYPFFAFMRPLCPSEDELMADWGHVRRGYEAGELARLFEAPPSERATFINPLTAFFHDVAFSRLDPRRRRLFYALAAPVAAVGYLAHRPRMSGSETVFAWRR
jgi:SAM-dependent methyltransferase